MWHKSLTICNTKRRGIALQRECLAVGVEAVTLASSCVKWLASPASVWEYLPEICYCVERIGLLTTIASSLRFQIHALDLEDANERGLVVVL